MSYDNNGIGLNEERRKISPVPRNNVTEVDMPDDLKMRPGQVVYEKDGERGKFYEEVESQLNCEEKVMVQRLGSCTEKKLNERLYE